MMDVETVLTARGHVRRPPRSLPLYSSGPRPGAGGDETVELTAIPYYRWANRTPGAMRVWIPTAS
jgi:DUF1680 family protein